MQLLRVGPQHAFAEPALGSSGGRLTAAGAAPLEVDELGQCRYGRLPRARRAARGPCSGC